MRIAKMKSKEDLFIEGINKKQCDTYHELFRKFYQSLVLFAMRYVDKQDEAEDVVQDLFLAVWEKEEKFFSYNSFRSFLYNSVRNTCLNKLKHRKVEEKFINYSLKNMDSFQSDDYDTLEEEIYRRLFNAINELPARCREIFLLHLDGKKNEEIAAELRITVLTVKTQKKKALRYLRARLGGLYSFLLFFLI